MSEIAAVDLRELNIKGNDILEAGCQPGVEVGRLLDKLLREAALGWSENESSQLLARAKVLIGQKNDD